MFTKIVAHEVRSMLREPSFIVLAAAYALLLAFSIYNGATWVRDRQEESNSRIEAQERSFSKKPAKIRSGYQPKESEPATAEHDPCSIGMSLQYAVLPFTPGPLCRPARPMCCRSMLA
ncbi:MAG: hypothetical protein IPK58_13485 [Acidobacteria bacterium]|nr:hypothetical protein [Acidobacteriota bacterium]